MVKLILIALVALIGGGLCQRELPKGYEFKCQPKEGQGILGMVEDLAKLNGPDYGAMLKRDSLRKVTEIMNGGALANLKKVRDTDGYKELAKYTCTKAWVDLDFYVDNAVEFYKYLQKEFAAKKPTPVDDMNNSKDFKSLMESLYDAERNKKMAAIALEHTLSDKSVVEANEAMKSDEFERLAGVVMTLEEWRNIEKAIEDIGIPSNDVLVFTQYYAMTFWKRNSASLLSVSSAFYVICAFYVIKTLRLF